VLRSGDGVDEPALRDFLRAYHFVDELPKTATLRGRRAAIATQ
jgi:hypothetical protein